MTVLPDTKAGEMLTVLRWLLIMDIWCFICITVAAMMLNFKLLNSVMNFKKPEVKHIISTITEEKPAGNCQNSLRGAPETSQSSNFK